MTRWVHLSWSALLLAGTSSIGLANAQETQTAPEAADATSNNDIVVTAQRRNERLQEVPLAISAFGEAALESGKINDVSDLNAKVPNVSLAPVGAYQFAGTFSIRGLGFADVESTFEPTVGTEIDGVYLSRNVGALLDLYDVESVQVMRGPQGTFFGRNTIGGAISVKSARPDGTFGGKIQGTIGNFGRREVRASVKAPITDTLSGKISGLYKDYDGYYHNSDGRKGPRDRTRSIRGTLAYENGGFDAALIADYTRIRGSGAPLENASLPKQTLALAGYPADDDGKPYHTYIGDPDTVKLNIWGVTLNMNLETPIGKLTSITGYRDTKAHTNSDFDGEQIRFFQVDRNESHYQISEELRLAGETGRLNYVLGTYFMKQRYEIATRQYGTLFGSPEAGSIAYSSQTAEAFAVFGQLDYEVIDGLTFTAGGRWGHEKKRFSTQPLFFPSSQTFSVSFSDFLPKLGINYKVNPDLMLYALYSEGYRSGGFNGRAANFTVVGPYAPERLKNYEIGFKSQLFDRMLTLNGTLFQMDYSDQQISVQENIGNINQTLVRNAATSRYKGVELETALRLGGFTLSGSLGYLDAGFRNFVANLGDGLGTIDRSKLPITFAPKWNFGLTGNWTGDVGIGELSAQATWSHAAKQYTAFTPINAYSDLALRPANDKLDASLSLKLENGVHVTLWGKNLTNEKVMTNTFTVGNLMSLRVWNAPREYGIDIGFEF